MELLLLVLYMSVLLLVIIAIQNYPPSLAPKAVNLSFRGQPYIG